MNSPEKQPTPFTYFNMVLVTIGISAILITMVKFISEQDGLSGVLLPWIGLLCILQYIYHIEDLAGIPKKFKWIRAGIMMLSVFVAIPVFF